MEARYTSPLNAFIHPLTDLRFWEIFYWRALSSRGKTHSNWFWKRKKMRYSLFCYYRSNSALQFHPHGVEIISWQPKDTQLLPKYVKTVDVTIHIKIYVKIFLIWWFFSICELNRFILSIRNLKTDSKRIHSKVEIQPNQ